MPAWLAIGLMFQVYRHQKSVIFVVVVVAARHPLTGKSGLGLGLSERDAEPVSDLRVLLLPARV